MRFSRNLDLRLEKFPANMPRDAEIGTLKQRVRRLRGGLQGSRIGQKMFFLNAELKQLVGHESAGMLPRWRHRPDAQSPIVRVEPEFHPWQFLFRCSRKRALQQRDRRRDDYMMEPRKDTTDLLFTGTLMSAQ